jgi:primosomal protein N' (replication factor Y) (superfamily II helicase)
VPDRTLEERTRIADSDAPGRVTARRRAAARQPAAELPVASVAVEISLPHLDRPFDYLVPAALAETAVPGCRVRVRFAGRLTGGFLLARTEHSEHQGKLGYLERVVSAEPVLTPELAGLARAVADWYGGTLADVLRLAIPPRHAAGGTMGPLAQADGAAPAAPAALAAAVPAGLPSPLGASALWDRYRDGPSFLAALADGRSPRAVWSALPGAGWPAEIAGALSAVAASGRGALVVVPDARDLELVDRALLTASNGGQLPPGGHTVLSASLGPAQRYRRWLAVARGEVTVVAGTRSAMFAPMADLGLVVLWDEGNDLHADPRAPYPHAREVLALRAHRDRAAALIGGYARTAEAELLVTTGWARSLAADRGAVRLSAPRVLPAGEETELARDEAARSARMPSIAMRTARDALAVGPVLFQVPRRGYLAAVGCERCRAQARCDCGGPAELPGPQSPLRCGWCGAAIGRTCRRCGHQGLRALVTGARRTAEELGRAFGSVPMVSSGGNRVVCQVGAEPAVVVATPGAEPVAESGYAAAILVDGWAMLGLASLRAAEEALRRWMAAAALVRPGPAGGSVVVVADASQRAVQALVRWDPATFASRELADRAELRFPPAARMASVTGPADAVGALLAVAGLPAHAELLGPLPVAGTSGGGGRSGRSGRAGQLAARPGTEREAARPGQELIRYLVRVPRSEGGELATVLRAGQAARSAAKEPGPVRVQLDPATLV